MKRIHIFVTIAISLTMLAAGIFIGQVAASPSAATGCFPDTNGHWAETFVCWMAENGIVGGYPDGTFKPSNLVTRAEAAVMIKRVANVSPDAGEILVGVSPTGWFPIVNSSTMPPPNNSFVYYSSNSVTLRSTDLGAKQYVASANAPVALYGRYTRLKGAKLCYTATAAAQLAAVMVMKVGNENNGQGTPNSFAQDLTSRQDENCRTYLISNPPNMTSGEHVAITATIQFNDINGFVKISSVTFIFDPTGIASPASVSGIAPPEDAQQPIMPLSEFPEWFGLDKGE